MPPTEFDLEDSDEDREEDRSGQMIYVNMSVDEGYGDNAAIFAYKGLRVAIKILFDQIEEFTLYPREGINLPPLLQWTTAPLRYEGSKSTPP